MDFRLAARPMTGVLLRPAERAFTDFLPCRWRLERLEVVPRPGRLLRLEALPREVTCCAEAPRDLC